MCAYLCMGMAVCMCHISYHYILQMHISFSLDGRIHRSNNIADTSFGSDLINFFLTSVGATFTEIRDVEIRFVFGLIESTSAMSWWISVMETYFIEDLADLLLHLCHMYNAYY